MEVYQLEELEEEVTVLVGVGLPGETCTEQLASYMDAFGAESSPNYPSRSY